MIQQTQESAVNWAEKPWRVFIFYDVAKLYAREVKRKREETKFEHSNFLLFEIEERKKNPKQPWTDEEKVFQKLIMWIII